MLLRVSALSKAGKTGPVLDGISLQVAAGKRLAIIGETGSGKTTLLKMMAGLVSPDAGEVCLNGHRVPAAHELLVPGHPLIAYHSQHFELVKSLTVAQILRYASKQTEEEADALHAHCHVQHLLERRTDQLSGGERQRVALALLLARKPQVLLLDEPYSNLDMPRKSVLKQVIENIIAQQKLACVLVSHDPADILPWADEVMVLQQGTVVQQDSATQVYGRPATAYVAGLLGRFMSSDELRPLFKELTNWPFVRPEHFALHHQQGVPAVVNKTEFMGSHYLVEVVAMEKVVWALSLTPWHEGTHVYVQLKF
jgi:iron(III) transport system ATP-binding protein